MLIIPETDSRSNFPGQGQSQQPIKQYTYPPANQNGPVQNPNSNWLGPNGNAQPTYPQPNPIYSTTARPAGPIWSGQGNQQPPTQTKPNYTERPMGPIWSSGGNAQGKPSIPTTTEAVPVWSANGANRVTSPAPAMPTQATTKIPANPFGPENGITVLPGFTQTPRPTNTPPPQAFKGIFSCYNNNY